MTKSEYIGTKFQHEIGFLMICLRGVVHDRSDKARSYKVQSEWNCYPVYLTDNAEPDAERQLVLVY